jgi:hypothetical protein
MLKTRRTAAGWETRNPEGRPVWRGLINGREEREIFTP